MTAKLSVCIPVLNEAAHLPRLLDQLGRQRDVNLEIVLGDGSSTDGSLDHLPPGAKIVATPPGRGTQMNAAARAAEGDYLLFLHADSQLGSPRQLADALAALNLAQRLYGPDRVAGHFELRFARRHRSERSFVWRYMEAKTALSRPGTINGDQGLLLTRAYFEKLGGFDEDLPLLEDQRIAERIRAGGVWITLPGTLTTSARRFETLGVARVYIFMALIMAMWRADVREFIAEVPALYRRRLSDGNLDMQAVFAALRETQRGRRIDTRWRTFYRIGRYARDNAWQAFFLLDIAARPPSDRRRYPLLAVYDHVLVWLLRNPLADILLGALVHGWMLLIVRPWFAWRDRPS